MAPTRPIAKPAGKPAVRKQHTSFAAKPSDSVFNASKRDKRLIKHSLLLSKIHGSGVKKSTKRRRPSNKLKTDLEALGDALADVEAEAEAQNAGAGTRGVELDARFKSLGSKRGVRKKREKLEQQERERFGKNLAVLSQAQSAEAAGKDEQTGGSSNRWAALRAHIQASMGLEKGTGAGAG